MLIVLLVEWGCLIMIRKYYRLLKKYNKLKADNKKYVFMLFLSSMFAALLKVSLPLFASFIVSYATEEKYEMAFYMIVFFGLIYLCYYFVQHLNYAIYTKHALYTHNKLQEKILDKVSNVDGNYSKELSQSFLVNTARTDIGEVLQIPDQCFDALSYFIMVIVSLGIILHTNTLIGIGTILTVLIYLVFLNKDLDKRDYYLDNETLYQDKTGHLLGQVFEGSKEIKSFNMNEDLHQYLDHVNKNWSKMHLSRTNYENYAEILDPVIITVFKLAIYAFVIYLIMQGKYNIGTLVLIISYLDTIINYCYELFDRLNVLSSNTVRLNRIHKIFSYKNEHMLSFGHNDTDTIFGDICFDHVDFEYENKPILKDVSFTVKANSFTAIVGRSGSGKSTIFRILLRLYKIKNGNVYIDGVNIYDYSKEVYASNVSIVTQKPFLFDMSIKENLSLVDSNFKNQVKVCKRVGIHDFIMQLPEGYNTKLTQDANNLSVGQKQLLALARTLLSKAEILLFDEVTSALDIPTSKKILKIMKELKKNHTILMITHKPSMMKKADEIIVLDRGEVCARGKHKELMEQSKVYNRLQK